MYAIRSYYDDRREDTIRQGGPLFGRLVTPLRKVFREFHPAPGRTEAQPRAGVDDHAQPVVVITSYSIHYTKLYEAALETQVKGDIYEVRIHLPYRRAVAAGGFRG